MRDLGRQPIFRVVRNELVYVRKDNSALVGGVNHGELPRDIRCHPKVRRHPSPSEHREHDGVAVARPGTDAKGPGVKPARHQGALGSGAIHRCCHPRVDCLPPPKGPGARRRLERFRRHPRDSVGGDRVFRGGVFGERGRWGRNRSWVSLVDHCRVAVGRNGDGDISRLHRREPYVWVLFVGGSRRGRCNVDGGGGHGGRQIHRFSRLGFDRRLNRCRLGVRNDVWHCALGRLNRRVLRCIGRRRRRRRWEEFCRVSIHLCGGRLWGGVLGGRRHGAEVVCIHVDGTHLPIATRCDIGRRLARSGGTRLGLEWHGIDVAAVAHSHHPPRLSRQRRVAVGQGAVSEDGVDKRRGSGL
mmetsp:Transcript_33270/g.87180  ORF Transcript_33270/g.87180 Transcript_33270/m.87180 type:complete len:356 (+) Transcript_33270:215-1282(+)